MLSDDKAATLIFEGEYQASASIFEGMGISRAEYIRSRRIDEGFTRLEELVESTAVDSDTEGGAEDEAESLQEAGDDLEEIAFREGEPLIGERNPDGSDTYWDPDLKQYVSLDVLASAMQAPGR